MYSHVNYLFWVTYFKELINNTAVWNQRIISPIPFCVLTERIAQFLGSHIVVYCREKNWSCVTRVESFPHLPKFCIIHSCCCLTTQLHLPPGLGQEKEAIHVSCCWEAGGVHIFLQKYQQTSLLLSGDIAKLQDHLLTCMPPRYASVLSFLTMHSAFVVFLANKLWYLVRTCKRNAFSWI